MSWLMTISIVLSGLQEAVMLFVAADAKATKEEARASFILTMISSNAQEKLNAHTDAVENFG